MKTHAVPLTPHAAHVLAARLREQGIYFSGRDVFRWTPRVVTSVELYLDHVGRGAGWRTFKDWMGEEMPPPSQHSWPGASAAGLRELDGAGGVRRPGNR